MNFIYVHLNRMIKKHDLDMIYVTGPGHGGPGLIIPTVNALAAEFAHVVLTQDWHPPRHSSFASTHPGRRLFETITVDYGAQICGRTIACNGRRVRGFILRWPHPTPNRSFARDFTPRSIPIRRFAKTTGRLRERGLERLTLCGLATDFCVLYSALDARAAGFAVAVTTRACCGIDLDGSLDAAMRAMAEAGVALVD